MTQTPTSANENTAGNSNERLIDLAYSMAVEPQRLNALSRILDERLHALHSAPTLVDGDVKPQEKDSLDKITSHFERAFDLLERQGRRFNYATGSSRFIDSDTRPSALFLDNGQVFHANSAAREMLDFTDGKIPTSERFEIGQYDRLMRDLKTLENHEFDKIISVYNLLSKDGDEQIKMALSRAVGYKGQTIGRLCTFHIKWLPEMGRQFQAGFELTDVEIAITKAVVSGVSLKDLADERGRSLATLRTQTKVLLSKLGLHSQVELACLYSGFTQFNLKNPLEQSKAADNKEPWRAKFTMTLPDKRILQYEMAGPPKGRPVLFFHALIGGLTLTQAMRDALLAQNIRLIMVWRPSFAGSSPDGKLHGSPERFAADIKYLLDHLSIDKCQIIGAISGAIYAYACAQFLPERISGIVNCGGCVPVATQAQFKKMDKSSRVTLYVARYTPRLLPMLMRAMLSNIDAGFDDEFVQELYAKSPYDSEILRDPELKPLIRDSFPVSAVQGYISFVRDIQVQASKWSYLLKGVTCPVTLLHSDQDPAFPLASVQAFIKNRPNFTLVSHPKSGQLIFFQHSKAMFEALNTQYENGQAKVLTG